MTERARTSGAEWLGVVPSHWEVVPARALFSERKERSTPGDVHLTPSQRHGVLPQTEYMAITGNKVVLNLTGTDNMRHVEPGDYISHLRSFQGGLEFSGLPGKVSAAYTVLKPKSAVDPRYFAYLFKSALYIQALQTTTDQLRDGQSIRFTQFSLIRLPNPPLEVQRAIADFLDRETAQIDAFIAKNEELITLLNERRLSVMTTMIERHGSGAPRAALRNLALVLDCKHVTAEAAAEGSGYAVASIREIKGKWVDTKNARRTSAESFRNLGEGGRQLRPWDLLICRNTSVGKLALVPQRIEPTVMGQDVSLVRIPNRDIARFVYYVLSSATGRDAFESASIGSTFRRINVDDIKAIRVPLVSPEIGRHVADSLDVETLRIDRAIARATRAIELARERRAALISATVTGKIDVGVAA